MTDRFEACSSLKEPDAGVKNEDEMEAHDLKIYVREFDTPQASYHVAGYDFDDDTLKVVAGTMWENGTRKVFGKRFDGREFESFEIDEAEYSKEDFCEDIAIIMKGGSNKTWLF